MTNHSAAVASIAIVALLASARAAWAEDGKDALVLSGKAWSVSLSRKDGAILGLRQDGREGAILRSGEMGLWHVRLRDGTQISAADFSPQSARRKFTLTGAPGAGPVRMTYSGPDIEVAVVIQARDDGLGFQADVTPRKGVVLDFALPARLRFNPDELERFICPASGNASVGTAFNAAFFKLQPQDRPSAWRPKMAGVKGYVALFGGPLVQRDDRDPPVPLRVTGEGRTWLGPALAGRVQGARAVVNRPPAAKQADLVLADSANGPYFSASRLGGSGLLWRLGGAVGDTEETLAAAMVTAVVDRLPSAGPSGRGKLGLVALERGPDRGGWASVSVREWSDRFRRLAQGHAGKLQFVELKTPAAMLAALAGEEFLAILNPYGEWIPTAEGGVEASVQAVARYVRAGGNWFEVGGHPFFYELQPVRYYQYGSTYPPAFADFFHLRTRGGTASVYRVQPRTWQPWQGAKDTRDVFVPGRLACGGDEKGGWCDRPFSTYVEAGRTWRCPAVRVTVGASAADDLRAYCRANALTRRLEDKMSPEVFARFKAGVLVYYSGGCKEKADHLGLLPAGSLIHFADYLKGGFDKEYPDHLPPDQRFGTGQELRAFFDEAHKLGHLVMPYTNPTWWCDDPKGPTFREAGEAPLLGRLDGKLSPERYADNVGFTICFWHPAVRAANRRTVQQFTKDYPVDVLFQDQCGARGWQYDTNPASPTPQAYTEGLLSMVDEDSRRVPLSTESGWDGVVNGESQLCGMTWSIVPTEGGPSWRRLMKADYGPVTWTVFPLAQHVAHDKCVMVHHDLGQFVTNRQVLAWTLGLGFCMSARVQAAALEQDATRQWLCWLDRVQKSVCSRYVGRAVAAFEHVWPAEPAADEDDGLIQAAYGDVKIVANLGEQPRVEGGREIAPYGFLVTAPGLAAGNLSKLDGVDFGAEGVSFVAEGDAKKADVWVYAPAHQSVRVLLPAAMPAAAGASLSLSWSVVAKEGEGSPRPKELRAEVPAAGAERGVLGFRVPALGGTEPVAPPAALADKAPRDWPGKKPGVAVLDLGPGVRPVWTRITAADWLTALGRSRLAKELGVGIVRITSVEQLQATLKAGPTACLAVVNPYGETFAASGPGKWRQMLDQIRRYVEGGGCWWETGGYSFHQAAWGAEGKWQRESVGPAGMAYLGLPVGGGEVDQPPEPLAVPPAARAWLGGELADRVTASASTVNRGLVRSRQDPGHVTLVAGAAQDFIGGCRLNGWGWLWRIGGFWPNPDVAVPVAIAAIEHLYTHPPEPRRPGGVRYVVHATVTAR